MGRVEKIFMTSTPTPFNIPELEAARLMGLPPAELKALRPPASTSLLEGEAYEKKARGRIMWSAAGIARAEALLATGATLSLAGDPPLRSDEKSLIVARVRTPRVLHVVESGQTYDPLRPVCLWLPRPVGKWFVGGMKVLGRRRNNGGQVIYDYAGNPAQASPMPDADFRGESGNGNNTHDLQP